MNLPQITDPTYLDALRDLQEAAARRREARRRRNRELALIVLLVLAAWLALLPSEWLARVL